MVVKIYMIPFEKQVTSPETDSVIMFCIGLGCIAIALLPPYGFHHHTAFFGVGAAVNLINCWRLRRKISAAKDSRPDSDSN
jgi:hypothetical protein